MTTTVRANRRLIRATASARREGQRRMARRRRRRSRGRCYATRPGPGGGPEFTPMGGRCRRCRSLASGQAQRKAKPMALHRKHADGSSPLSVNPVYTRGGEVTHAPRHSIPDTEMLPETAYQIVHDELMLDGN